MLQDISSIGFTVFTVALLVLPAVALAHLVKNKYRGRSLLNWVLIIIFLPFFGAILYFVMGKRSRKFNP